MTLHKVSNKLAHVVVVHVLAPMKFFGYNQMGRRGMVFVLHSTGPLRSTLRNHRESHSGQ
jgi:hypothetical protein